MTTRQICRLTIAPTKTRSLKSTRCLRAYGRSRGGAAAPDRDIQLPGELQHHLRDVLDDDALTDWPRTDTGKLLTRRQQLQLNAHIPAIAELLKVRALGKLIDAFGDGLIEAVNPVTGRLHASFRIAAASNSCRLQRIRWK